MMSTIRRILLPINAIKDKVHMYDKTSFAKSLYLKIMTCQRCQSFSLKILLQNSIRMDLEFLKNIRNISGINLSDYIPDKSSYNPIVYIHKRNFSKDRNGEKNVEKTPKISKTHDKSQQYDCNNINRQRRKNIITEPDPLLEQTIKFAKDIIPITIPPTTNVTSNPVHYKIKSSKKSKRKHECEHKLNPNSHVNFNEEKIHELQEKNKRSKVSNSIEESPIHYSQNDTIDDFNGNRSLCSSLSEISEQKQFNKEEYSNKTKIKEGPKVITSESFDAIATQYTKCCGDSNIKVHLMNGEDKKILSQNISAPIVNTIKELFMELHNQIEVSQDMSHVHKAIEIHSNKLDRILDRLGRIERKLDKLNKEQNSETHSKTSKLEYIGKDIEIIKEHLSSEEELAQVNLLVKKGSFTSVTSIAEKEREEINDLLSKGENVPEYYKTSTSQLGIKPERLNRIPARFCWTDSVKKN